jgi:vacuolar-type H+-ATPase subunit F/Vma7
MRPGAPAQEVVAIGADPLLDGFGLVGVRTLGAVDADEVRAAWRMASERSAVVVLTADAAAVLGAERTSTSAPLSVVLPP